MDSGRRRLGEFEIVREIGRGGMGVVYEAIQLSLNRRVALKVLPPGTTPEQRDIERFQREARAAASLDHPNIVPIYAQGDEEGTHYYAMRLVQGRSLDQIIHDVRGIDLPACTSTELVRTITADSQATIALEERPTVPLEEGAPEEAPPERRPTDLSSKYFRTAARLIMEVAEALEYAHSQGVIHRDIKPHNLMLTPEGHLVVTDFGLARFLSAPSITVSGEMMGTPAYMSPEQVRAEQQRIGHRTDIYSLGVTLYELLALEVPFRADTREALLRQIVMKDPPPLRRINARIPRDLEAICAKAIEKDPDRRYQSAKDFAHDLSCFLEGLPIAARPIGPIGRVYRRALRRRALTAAIAIALLLLIVAPYFGVQAYRARQAEIEARSREEAERRAKEAEATAKLDEQRWNLLAEARSFLEDRRYLLCLETLGEAALIKHDHATHLSFWRLARSYCDNPLAMSRGHGDAVECVAFSPDGNTLASGSWDKTVKLWDAATGRELRTLSGHTETVQSVAFSPDGKTLASGSEDKSIRLWDAATGRELHSLSGHTGRVWSVAFSPDGRSLASGSRDETIKLWDVDTEKELRTLAGHTDGVVSVAFSPDGKTLASGSDEHTIKLWDPATGRELRTLTAHTDEAPLFDGGWEWVNSVAFSPDGKTLASGSGDKTIKLWDVTTGRELRTLAGHAEGVSSVAFSLDGKILASGSFDDTIRLWNVVSSEKLLALRINGEGTGCIALSPDGKTLASGSFDNTIKLWDVAVGRELRSLGGHTRSVESVAFSPDGKNLASGSMDGTIRLWDVATGRELRTLTGHTSLVNFVAFSPDGKRLASGSFDNTIKLWDVDTGKELRTLAGHTDGVVSVAFSPDGKTLASGSDEHTVKLWGPATGRELRTLSGHRDKVCSVAFSPDGKTLASGSVDKTVKLWDVATGRELRTLAGHPDWVLSAAFSPDGKTLASGSVSLIKSNIKLWDVLTGREVVDLAGSPALLLGFSPDGRNLLCAVPDGGFNYYDFILIYDFHAYDEQIERWLREAGVDADLSSQ